MINVLAVTGYKSHEVGIYSNNHDAVSYIKGTVKSRLVRLIEDGLTWVVISGQSGVELWAGEAVLELREEYPEINLAVLTPFLDQERRWKDASKKYYNRVVSQADYVGSISKRRYENPDQFHAARQFIIQKSDALLVLYDADQAGTPEYYLRSAHRYQQCGNEYPILLISFFDINDFIEDCQQTNSSNWVT